MKRSRLVRNTSSTSQATDSDWSSEEEVGSKRRYSNVLKVENEFDSERDRAIRYSESTSASELSDELNVNDEYDINEVDVENASSLGRDEILYATLLPPDPESHLWAILRADESSALRYVLATAIKNQAREIKSSSRIDILDILYYSATVQAQACTTLLLTMDYHADQLQLLARECDSLIGTSNAINCNEAMEAVAMTVTLNPAAIVAMRKGKRVLPPGCPARSRLSELADASVRQYCYTPVVWALTHPRGIDIARTYCERVPQHVLAVLKSVAPGQREPLLLHLLSSAQNYWMILSILSALDDALLKRERGARSKAKAKPSRLHNTQSAGARAGEWASGTLQSKTLMRFLETTVARDGQNCLHWVSVFGDEGGTYTSTAGASDQVQSGSSAAPESPVLSTSMFVDTLCQMAPSLLSQQTKRGLFATHYAALGSADVLAALLRNGASPLAADEQGWSPFLYALMTENVASAMVLLKDASGHHASAAVPQLRLLGSLVQQTKVADKLCSGANGAPQADGSMPRNQDLDKRLQRMLVALGTVLEFRTLLNDVLRENMSLLDEELGFLLAFPSLISLDNKLAIGKKAICALSHESQDIEGKFPILDSAAIDHGGAADKVLLGRDAPWGHFVAYALGRVDAQGKSFASTTASTSCSSVSSSMPFKSGAVRRESSGTGHRFTEDRLGPRSRLLAAARRFKNPLMFQYKAEAGCGKGVERELFDALATGMILTVSRNSSTPAPRGVAFSASSNTQCRQAIFHKPEDEEQTYLPLPLQHEMHLARYEGFYCCGVLVGHFLLRRMENTFGSLNTSLGISLSLCFWKLVLNKTPALEDLATMDESLHRSMAWMLEHTDEVADLGLTFVASSGEAVEYASGSQSATDMELKPGGANLRVTAGNVKDYVRLMTQHCTTGRMFQQACAVRRGMLAVVPSLVLSLFSEQELTLMMTGSSVIEVDNWKTYAVAGGALATTTCGTAVWLWFWNLVADMTQLERSLLLRFCTGCSRVPLGGFQQLKPQFNVTVTPYNESTSLPTAATCFNLLKLPLYPSEKLMRKNILIAITYGSEGFSFS